MQIMHWVFLQTRGCYVISLLRGWVAGLPLICIKYGAPGYKAVGKAHIYDSMTIINTINLPSCLYAPPVNLDRGEWVLEQRLLLGTL